MNQNHFRAIKRQADGLGRLCKDFRSPKKLCTASGTKVECMSLDPERDFGQATGYLDTYNLQKYGRLDEVTYIMLGATASVEWGGEGFNWDDWEGYVRPYHQQKDQGPEALVNAAEDRRSRNKPVVPGSWEDRSDTDWQEWNVWGFYKKYID